MCVFFSSYSLNMESEIEEKDLTDDITKELSFDFGRVALSRDVFFG